MNQSNCATCDHKQYPGEGGHCYMFRSEPDYTCMQHTGRKHLITGGSGAMLIAAVAGVLAGRPEGLSEIAPVVSPAQFLKDFMATARGERPAPDYAGKTVYATQKAREEAASNDGASGAQEPSTPARKD